MLTTETASAVVQKGQQDMAEKQIDCHATSSFLVEGEHIENGSNLVIPEPLYRELRGANRVEPGHVAPREIPSPDAGDAKGKSAKG